MSGSAGALLDALPGWATLYRAPNPGPMTLTGTNTWVLGGSVVVDPGPPDDEHLAQLTSAELIIVTHGHHDHVEGAPRLAELTGAPVLAADREHGQPLPELIEAAGLSIRVLRTPGHTSDSVSLVVNDEAVLTGDTILGQGSTIVAHPDGNLAAYLGSLDRLAALGDIPALPGHGPALASVRQAASHYREHRLARLEQVRSAVLEGAASAADVVKVVYRDTDPALWWAAELTVQAQLDYLNSERS
ncbi:MBL fold metallo-hydrolase [Longispora albida]|uniref:MBL fold metallo-hydrolase n=1 Tax=Longispora albida TaxID=203523 RepID=UPI000380D20B|nr:MBL fold metallo-hydrolase [Longispora albida]